MHTAHCVPVFDQFHAKAVLFQEHERGTEFGIVFALRDGETELFDIPGCEFVTAYGVKDDSIVFVIFKPRLFLQDQYAAVSIWKAISSQPSAFSFSRELSVPALLADC
jgi:hypothetical protein